MSLLLRLTTVIAIAILLQGAPATEVITAPSTVTDDVAGLETREQGPTAWICSALAVDSPWTSYANIRGYLEGGNAEGKDYSNLVLYPVMELFHASESRLCVYLPAVDHCYPPPPSTNQVKTVKQLFKNNYYDIRFWGQASDARVQYFKQKLTAALNAQSKAAKFDLFFVSYFSDHVREIRYDPASMAGPASIAGRRSAEPQTESDFLTCPTAPGNNISGTTAHTAGQEYLFTTLPESRLKLNDVQTKILSGSSGQSKAACATAASSDGENAFSFVNGTCKVYNFEENFCPCKPGDFEIYINKNRWAETKEITRNYSTAPMKKIVIYTELPLTIGFPANHVGSVGRLGETSDCDERINAAVGFNGGFVVNNRCFKSYVHDLPNCNRTCKGQPVDAFVRKVDTIPNPPFLSLCGQTRLIQMHGTGNQQVNMQYLSHYGLGCYRYPEAKTLEEEDCVVTFEKDPNADKLVIMVFYIRVDRGVNTCHDVLSIYSGNTTQESSLKRSTCFKKSTLTTKGDALTVKFHRQRGSGPSNLKNGFKMTVQSV